MHSSFPLADAFHTSCKPSSLFQLGQSSQGTSSLHLLSPCDPACIPCFLSSPALQMFMLLPHHSHCIYHIAQPVPLWLATYLFSRSFMSRTVLPTHGRVLAWGPAWLLVVPYHLGWREPPWYPVLISMTRASSTSCQHPSAWLTRHLHALHKKPLVL